MTIDQRANLTLTDADAAEPLVLELFTAAHVGSWQRFESFRADVLRSLGWTDALDRFRAEHGIPEDHLDWNPEFLDRHVLDVHDAVYLDGWWHVFYK